RTSSHRLSSLRCPFLVLLFFMLPPPPSSTLFPYTTLFRSERGQRVCGGLHLSGGPQLAGLRVSAGAAGGAPGRAAPPRAAGALLDRKSTRLNSSHVSISYAVFCLKKKTRVDAPSVLELSVE